MLAAFPTDLKDAPFTTTGIVHGALAMLAFLSLMSGTLLLSAGFKNRPGLAQVYKLARFLVRAMGNPGDLRHLPREPFRIERNNRADPDPRRRSVAQPCFRTALAG